jgi:hypothetical protein
LVGDMTSFRDAGSSALASVHDDGVSGQKASCSSQTTSGRPTGFPSADADGSPVSVA